MHERNGKNTIFSVVCVFERLSAIRCLFYIYACNLLKWFSMDFSSFLALRFVLSLYYYFFGAWPTSRFNFCSSFSVIRGFWYSSWLAFFFFFIFFHFISPSVLSLSYYYGKSSNIDFVGIISWMCVVRVSGDCRGYENLLW